jgi:tRNA A37 threonylcarbamoyladenosine dehydratase
MKDRIHDINPDISVNIYNMFYSSETANTIDFTKYDYIVDAIDTVSGKIDLVMKANEYGVKIISSMGAGNKIDPCGFKVADIYKTSVCPLARVMRNELKKREIKKLKVVYSEEQPKTENIIKEEGKVKMPPASCAFIPSVVGLIVASEVIKDLMK